MYGGEKKTYTFFTDPFVKVYLLQNGKKVSKKKTTVKRGEKCPIFNEAMIFSVPSSVLSVSIMDPVMVPICQPLSVSF